MRNQQVYIFCICFLGSLFVVPVSGSDSENSANAELEDYALRGVLDNLGVTHLLNERDIEKLKTLTYINLHTHIASLREYEGNISNPKWRESKIRALNAIGVMWAKHPPNKTSVDNPEWNKLVEENNALIEWAMKECKSHPEYGCRSE